MSVLFWLSAVGLFYIYAGYPLLIMALARWRPRPVRRGPGAARFSVVIAAHNEAANLRSKIESILASDCADRLEEILVGSDGSSDRTAEIVVELGNPRVRCVAFDRRRGKPAVLNDVVPMCRSEIVVLTDARQPVEPTAIVRLLSVLDDPEVGVVSGELVFRAADGSAVSGGVGAYWSYEKAIRKHEARFGSVPGATGALYAIRRPLFRPIPPDTLLDDVAIPMRAVAQGCRCVFEEGARVYDAPSTSAAQEAVRKRRTIAGNAQLAARYPRWLLPGGHPAWFQFASHKVARLFSPLFLVAALASAWMLRGRGPYAAALGLQAGFYAAAAAGWLLHAAGRRAGILAIPFVFVHLNLITVQALWDAATGRFAAAWQRAYTDNGGTG
jgi:cellulose synthase/poly-beta-1,6-N-acetylglucosamine synthase-like glycosyltransferase